MNGAEVHHKQALDREENRQGKSRETG